MAAARKVSQGAQQDRFVLLDEVVAELGNAGGFSGTVHANYKDHGGAGVSGSQLAITVAPGIGYALLQKR